jgi:hypothetical protein
VLPEAEEAAPIADLRIAGNRADAWICKGPDERREGVRLEDRVGVDRRD